MPDQTNDDLTSKPSNPTTAKNKKLLHFFTNAKEFNLGMAILDPSIRNVLQNQVENEFAMLGMYQVGSGGLTFFGNLFFHQDGDRSMQSRMGMLSGGIKTLLGLSLFAIGMAHQLAQSKESNLFVTLNYLGYGIKTLSTVIELFNAGAYGKEAVSATRELSMMKLQ